VRLSAPNITADAERQPCGLWRYEVRRDGCLVTSGETVDGDYQFLEFDLHYALLRAANPERERRQAGREVAF